MDQFSKKPLRRVAATYRGELMKRTTLGVAVAAALLTASAGAQQSPIKIGFITELSGAWGFYGNACIQGLKMAQEEINAAGGVLDRPLDFVVVDNQTNPAQAVAAARNLDMSDNVVAISGPTSSDVALALYGYAEQQKLPFLVPIAAFPQLTKPGTRYTFRLEPSAAGWGYAVIKFIEQLRPGAKIAVVYSDAALMRAVVAGLRYQAALSNIAIVSDVMFPLGSTDATVQAAQVRSANPDYVVVIGGGAFDYTLTNQLLDMGVVPNQIVHPWGTATQILGWGPRSVGSYFLSFFDIGLDYIPKGGRDFIAKFEKLHGRPPGYNENFCYLTAYVFKEAIAKAGTVNREELRKALSEIRMNETTSGVPIVFDKNGARKEYVYVLQIQSVDNKTYKAKQVFYTEWDPEVIPVYQLLK